MTSHEDWARNSGIKSYDRAIHEHKTLSKICELLLSYDQLNVVNLAGFEVAIKRRMLLEVAHRGRPDAPQFSGSEHLMGYKDSQSGEILDPEALRYQSARLRDEANYLKEARLKKEEDAAHKTPGKGGKGGKGGGAQAQE